MMDAPVQNAAQGTGPRRSLAGRLFAPVVVVLSLALAVATFLILMGLTSIVPTPQVVAGVLSASGVAVLILLAIIGLEVWRILRARARGRAASRLHVRIIALFAGVAVVPAIVVAVVASLTLDRSLDRYFSTRTQEIVGSAASVAQTYVREHALSIRGDALAMANDLSRMRSTYDSDIEKFRQVLTAQAALRNVPGAQLIHKDLSVVDRANLRMDREFTVPPDIAINEASAEQPIIYLPSDAVDRKSVV